MIPASPSLTKAALILVGIFPSLINSFVFDHHDHHHQQRSLEVLIPSTKRDSLTDSVLGGRPFDSPSTRLNLFRQEKKEKHNILSRGEIEDNGGIQNIVTPIPDDKSGTNSKMKKQKETLRFGGKYSYRSQVFSYSSSSSPSSDQILNELLYNFFDEERSQHILLSGGTNSTIRKISMEGSEYDGLLNKWCEKISQTSLGAEEPERIVDSVVIVTPPGIDILTVSIIPTTTIGTKLIEVESSINDQVKTLPEFQATLIEDEPVAKGPKFFVWLFNKIVYGGNPDEIIQQQQYNDRNETAFLRFYVQPIESENITNGNEINFVFVAESSMWLEFLFPKLLLRFFPMKKEKAEELCSGAILKALEKNMKPAMDEFCNEYIESIQTK